MLVRVCIYFQTLCMQAMEAIYSPEPLLLDNGIGNPCSGPFDQSFYPGGLCQSLYILSILFKLPLGDIDFIELHVHGISK